MAGVSRPVRRGQIWWIDWEPHRGSEQAGRRPSLVIQSNEANELDSYDLVILLTMSCEGHSDNALHINVDPSKLNGLSSAGFVKCEQILTIAKARLDGYIGHLEPRYMKEVEENLRDMLDLA